MLLRDFQPRPKLVVNTSLIPRPCCPVIDAHNHLAEPFGGGWDKRPLAELLDVLDEAGVRCYVDLDGGWGESILKDHLKRFRTHAPERFIHFGGVDWSQWAQHATSFGEWAAARLRLQAQWGAQGLKIWKAFGLQVRDPQGNLALLDDPRLAPLWDTAGELNLPVMIHVADPAAFFDPLDAHNERWEELQAHPDWHFPSPPYPSLQNILQGLESLVCKHPQTTFIGAHVGCYAENLAWVAGLLDQCPNFYIDISARINELGRQPYTARRFFLKYADRILFGSDMGPDLEVYRIYYRFLESDDEYFNYSPGIEQPQGRWNVYGLSLPDDVLKKVYSENAKRVFGME